MTTEILPTVAVEHRLAGGAAGPAGENSATCACGLTYDGFDTHREAVDLIVRHVAEESTRPTKRADQLANGDLAAYLLDGDPWTGRLDGKVLTSHPYVDDIDRARVLLVVEGSGVRPVPVAVRLDADTLVGLRTTDELVGIRQRAERAERIAEIRAFADFLEQNPWAPMESLQMQWSPNPHGSLFNSGVEGVAQIRQLAEKLGAEVREITDRTEIVRRFGEVEYRLIAWHKDGRPVEAEPEDSTGLGYSRELDEVDEARPVSPARGDGPVPTGGVVAGGALVDETPGPWFATEKQAEQVTVHFSFGGGHTDPDTGKSLLDHYVTIVGPSYEACRAAMFASKYGRAWSFDYIPGTPQADKWIPRWTEHERIILPADAQGEPECSPECDDQDGDRPHLADCPARDVAEIS